MISKEEALQLLTIATNFEQEKQMDTVENLIEEEEVMVEALHGMRMIIDHAQLRATFEKVIDIHLEKLRKEGHADGK
jgi:hypothetical protein